MKVWEKIAELHGSEIKKLYLNGCTLRAIGRQVGVDHKTIKCVIDSLNLTQQELKTHQDNGRKSQTAQLTPGARYGNLTCVGGIIKAKTSNGNRKRLMSFRCDCGKEIATCPYSVLNGASKSCGCAMSKNMVETQQRLRIERNREAIEVCGDYLKVPLSNGKITFVSAEDLELVVAHSWHQHRAGYVITTIGKSSKCAYLHRLIMNPEKGQVVDHANNNRLDNRRNNLRVCSHSQNHANTLKPRGNTSSRFKGVTWDKSKNKWAAAIKYKGKKIFLGRYTSELEAAKSYNRAAKEHFGEFAFLNDLSSKESAETDRGEPYISAQDERSIINFTGGKCARCGSREKVQIDHIYPLACGGTNEPENTQPLCQKCNNKKRTEHKDYRPLQGSLF